MHVINLGVSLWTCGAVLHELLDYGLWPDACHEVRFRKAYMDFMSWTQAMKIPHLVSFTSAELLDLGFSYAQLRHTQPPFNSKCTTNSTHPYAEFRAKAYNVSTAALQRLSTFSDHVNLYACT